MTSDCDADADVFNNHHFNPTKEESVKAVLQAGTDIDCGGFVGSNAQSALDKKVITEDDIKYFVARELMELSKQMNGSINAAASSDL